MQRYLGRGGNIVAKIPANFNSMKFIKKIQSQKAAHEEAKPLPDLANYKKPVGPAVDAFGDYRARHCPKCGWPGGTVDEDGSCRHCGKRTMSAAAPMPRAKDGYSDKCTQCGGTGRKMIAGQNRICPSCDGSGKEEYSYFVHGSAGDVASV